MTGAPRRRPESIDRGPQAANHPASLATEVAHLETLDLGQLRVQYRNRTGRIAPARVSRSLLVRVLAYRIQADALGDLDRASCRLLDQIGAAGDRDGATAVPVIESSASLKPGTLLKREWQGRMEHVMVVRDGFVWNGTTHPSLSATAYAITGTKWNGYRFFGVPSPAAPTQQNRPRVVSPPAMKKAVTSRPQIELCP